MKHLPRVSLAGAVWCVCLCLWLHDSAHAQTAPVLSGPAGTYTSTITLATAGPITLSSPFAGPAGSYTVVAPGAVTITSTATSYTISWGVGPNPSPPTPPIPPPPTPEVSGHVWVMGIYEYDDLPSIPAPQQDLRTSTTIAAALNGLDATWKEYDKDNPALAGWMGYMRKITPVPVPFLLVVGGTANGPGKFVEAIALPADEAGVIAEVKRIRGVK